MGPRSAVPILLLALAAAACRSAAPSPPLAEPASVPEELRLYAVDDVLDLLAGVPRQGCCVLPFPETGAAVYPVSWAAPGKPVERTAERRREPELRGSRAAEEVRMSGFPRIPGAAPSSPLSEPAEALLEHIRSRLAAGEGAPTPCRLEIRGGTTLEARGSPAALEKVERALADLR